MVPLTLTFPELQQQRGHLAVVWNLATNAVVDFLFIVTRVLVLYRIGTAKSAATAILFLGVVPPWYFRAPA